MPASPALAASIAAFRARRLVWSEIDLIILLAVEICNALSFVSKITSWTFCEEVPSSLVALINLSIVVSPCSLADETSSMVELRDLIRNIISDLIQSSANNINKINKCDKTILWDVKGETKKRSIKYKEDSNKKKYLNSLIINFSHECREAYYSLREFLDEHYIFSPEVQKSDAKAQVVVEWLFNILKTNYKLMPLNVRNEVDKSIILEVQKNLSLKNIFNKLQKNNQNIVYLEKKIKEQKEDKQNEYNEIKDKVVSRKVATYIATMSDSYAEGMYRNLIGSKVDFII